MHEGVERREGKDREYKEGEGSFDFKVRLMGGRGTDGRKEEGEGNSGG